VIDAPNSAHVHPTPKGIAVNMAGIMDRTVTALIESGADRHPDKVALRSPDEQYTYAELRHTALQVGAGFRALGLERQQPVLLMLDNHVEHMLCDLGAALIGGIQVGVNPAFKGNMLSYIINNSLAEIMVIEECYCERLAAIADELTTLQRVVVRGGSGADLQGRFAVTSFAELLSNEPVSPVHANPWDIYGIMYTSGTTGPSKGVMINHAGIFSHFHPVHFGGVGTDDITMVALPLFHMAAQALVFNALSAGASAVIFDGFHATKFWDEVREYECTFTLLLGTMANFLYRQPETDRDADNPLTRVLMVPVIPEVEEFTQRFGVEIGTAYGMTEASTPVFAPWGTAKPGACGFIRGDFEAQLVNEHDIEVKPGEIGELLLRPKEPWILMAGYYNMPEATSAAWRNLWFHTGDALFQDTEGQFHFVDRRKDAIRRRGENVSSFEVEAEINSHTAVMESAAIAVPSEHTEDDIMAVIVLKEGQSVGHAELIDYLLDRLPYFMVPRYLEFRDALPKTASQKIRKAVLREQGLTEQTWDREAAGIKVTRES
jgi:carnitine-CoA ligase